MHRISRCSLRTILVVAAVVATPASASAAVVWNGNWDVGGIPHGTVCTGRSDSSTDQYDRVEELGNVKSATCGLLNFDTTRTRNGLGRSLHILMKGKSATGTSATQREQPSSKYTWNVDDKGTTDLWFGSSVWLGSGWYKDSMTTSKWATFHSWRSSAANGSMNTEIHPASDGVPHFWLRRNTVYSWPDGLGTDMMDLGPVPYGANGTDGGRWTDFVFHIRFSTTSSNALREAWVNGIYKGRKTSMNAVAGTHRFRAGVYQTTSIPQTRELWWDQVKVGTSYADVDPAAG